MLTALVVVSVLLVLAVGSAVGTRLYASGLAHELETERGRVEWLKALMRRHAARLRGQDARYDEEEVGVGS
jgi:hypothetical protein